MLVQIVKTYVVLFPKALYFIIIIVVVVVLIIMNIIKVSKQLHRLGLPLRFSY
jgi:hypothetical protein